MNIQISLSGKVGIKVLNFPQQKAIFSHSSFLLNPSQPLTGKQEIKRRRMAFKLLACALLVMVTIMGSRTYASNPYGPISNNYPSNANQANGQVSEEPQPQQSPQGQQEVPPLGDNYPAPSGPIGPYPPGPVPQQQQQGLYPPGPQQQQQQQGFYPPGPYGPSPYAPIQPLPPPPPPYPYPYMPCMPCNCGPQPLPLGENRQNRLSHGNNNNNNYRRSAQ